MTQAVLQRKVALIGCGPVGLLGSLLLQHFGIQYVAFQKYPTPRSHPSAHWLSANSKAIFSQIPKLVDQVNISQQPWDNFRYYRYLQGLFGHQLGITDHFKPNIEEKLKKSVSLYGQTPNHIPQNILLQILYERLQNKQNLIFDKQIIQIKECKQQPEKFILYDKYQKPIVECKYLIICSGANNSIRNNIPPNMSPFRMEGNSNLLSVINIHFNSKQLADKLKKQNHNAMLHFIYTKKIIAILVNHSIQKTGTFVLQIPNYEPFIDLMEVYSARDMINMIFAEEKQIQLKDIDVIHIGKWKLQALLANQLQNNRIFLAGDSAHAFPPAGGFGMNSGFQDVNDLVHSIFLAEKNEKSSHNKIFRMYSQRRHKINSQYLKKSLENFQITKNISKSLGYSSNILDYFNQSTLFKQFTKFMPSYRNKFFEPARLRAMSLMYRRQLSLKGPQLQLFFDQFDSSIQKLSKIRNKILKNVQKNKSQTYSFYARQGDITPQQISQKYGNIFEKNIKFFARDEKQYQGAEKLISSSGNVLIQ